MSRTQETLIGRFGSTSIMNGDLWGPDIGDTVFYHPPTQALIAYKGQRFFLMNVMAGDKPGLNDWATGVYSAEGAQGSWQDAEDGWLSQNAVSRGEVDCVGMLSLGQVQAGEKRTCYHWLAANTSLGAVLDDNRLVRFRTPDTFIHRTQEYWSFWVRKHRTPKPAIPQDIWDLYHRSLLTLRTQVDNTGAIIAGNDPDIARETGDTYSYLFPRVGAITAVALDRAGLHGPDTPLLYILSSASLSGRLSILKVHASWRGGQPQPLLGGPRRQGDPPSGGGQYGNTALGTWRAFWLGP